MPHIVIALQSILIGGSLAGPVGIVGLICIRQTSLHGRRAGLRVGIGSALADGLAVMGVTLTMLDTHPWIVQHNTQLRFAGGLLLLVIGLHSLYLLRRYRSSVDDQDARFVQHTKIRSGFLAGALYTLINPLTYITYIGLAATVLVSWQTSALGWLLQGVGVTVGAFCWWLLVTVMTNRGVQKYGDLFVRRLNLLSAIIVTITGIGVIFVALS